MQNFPVYNCKSVAPKQGQSRPTHLIKGHGLTVKLSSVGLHPGWGSGSCGRSGRRWRRRRRRRSSWSRGRSRRRRDVSSPQSVAGWRRRRRKLSADQVDDVRLAEVFETKHFAEPWAVLEQFSGVDQPLLSWRWVTWPVFLDFPLHLEDGPLESGLHLSVAVAQRRPDQQIHLVWHLLSPKFQLELKSKIWSDLKLSLP